MLMYHKLIDIAFNCIHVDGIIIIIINTLTISKYVMLLVVYRFMKIV